MIRARRGVALMLTLWLIVVLAMIGARVSGSARSATSVAGNLRARTSGKYAAESGIVFATERIRARLASLPDAGERAVYLNSLESISSGSDGRALGDARFAFAHVDVSARIDVNNASRAQLARLFAFFTGPVEAAKAADAIRSRIEADNVLPGDRNRYGPARIDISYPAMPAAKPLRSLDEMERIPGISRALALSAAPYLTVDGDGRINRAAASDTVLAAAAGSLIDQPSRILVISRGWLSGHPLTHEIQAVYAIEGVKLILVRWQERDL